MSKEWTVKLYGIRETEAGRTQMPLSEISKEELNEILLIQNERALRAAGYYPVESRGREN